MNPKIKQSIIDIALTTAFSATVIGTGYVGTLKYLEEQESEQRIAYHQQANQIVAHQLAKLSIDALDWTIRTTDVMKENCQAADNYLGPSRRDLKYSEKATMDWIRIEQRLRDEETRLSEYHLSATNEPAYHRRIADAIKLAETHKRYHEKELSAVDGRESR